eukprot:4676596-Prymnesium_polylepis.1
MEERAFTRVNGVQRTNPHIIAMLDHTIVGDTHYLVMEAADRDLLDVLADAGALHERQLLPLFAMLVDG